MTNDHHDEHARDIAQESPFEASPERLLRVMLRQHAFWCGALLFAVLAGLARHYAR